MVISISFSVVIYRSLVSEVERFDQIQRTRIEIRFGYAAPTVTVDPSLIEETERRIVVTLVFINVIILAVSGLIGYFLAGITLAPISEMIDEQNRFISDASHELGTPLTSLKTAFEVYLREKKPTIEESKTLATESIEEVNKLQTLSSSLLTLARHEKPIVNTKIEKISLKEVVNSAVKQVNNMAHEKEISIACSDDVVKLISNVKVYGDKDSLEQLLVIILDNAIKYSTKESSIEIKTAKSDHHVLISVTDHGIGIAKEDLPHIFDRFYRTDMARSRKATGGYGLGLSIARKIVEEHGGSINVKSEINKGSTFEISLPL
ncbi:MAG TPA: HAMP domain-containing sensor histidine kinase [Patescibacteria group bacterium]|nr:HAMP domain-containing sensor histidine kinase [Patescibacteria group bacterium]